MRQAEQAEKVVHEVDIPYSVAGRLRALYSSQQAIFIHDRGAKE